jgi:nicotinamidase-related amidase
MKHRALIVVDVWDKHWHEPTNKLLARGFGKRINSFVSKMRDEGVFIFHAPSSTAWSYTDRRPTPVLPQFSGMSSAVQFFNTPREEEPAPVWHKQHPDIQIEPEDYISDNADQIFSILSMTNCYDVYLVGLHLDRCIMDNSFGAQNLKWIGFNPIIIADLTDTMVMDKEEAVAAIAGAAYTIKTTKEILK